VYERGGVIVAAADGGLQGEAGTEGPCCWGCAIRGRESRGPRTPRGEGRGRRRARCDGPARRLLAAVRCFSPLFTRVRAPRGQKFSP